MGPYYAENWEDPEEFHRYIYLEVSEEGFQLWDKAIQEHWFVMNSKDFRYYEYYKHLKAMRGIEAKCKYAECFNIDDYKKKVVITQEDPINALRPRRRQPDKR